MATVHLSVLPTVISRPVRAVMDTTTENSLMVIKAIVATLAVLRLAHCAGVNR